MQKRLTRLPGFWFLGDRPTLRPLLLAIASSGAWRWRFPATPFEAHFGASGLAFGSPVPAFTFFARSRSSRAARLSFFRALAWPSPLRPSWPPPLQHALHVLPPSSLLLLGRHGVGRGTVAPGRHVGPCSSLAVAEDVAYLFSEQFTAGDAQFLLKTCLLLLSLLVSALLRWP